MSEEHPAVRTLQHASDGLWIVSETDEPLTPFFWPSTSGEELSAEGVQQFAKASEDVLIETEELVYFFRNHTNAHEWHDEVQAAQLEKFRQLVDTIEATLENVQVFRVGEISIDVYIVGQVDGGYAGLQTLVVET